MADNTNLSGDEHLNRGTMRDSVTDTTRTTKADDVGVDGKAVGGVSGLAAGAAIGAATGGPIGAVIGAAAGALAGVGVAKGVDLAVNPEQEDKFWRENYATRPYAAADRGYETYQPAYRDGWESRAQYADKKYEDVEPDLERGWDRARGASSLAWNDAKHATKDAWHRIERAVPGDLDRDGR